MTAFAIAYTVAFALSTTMLVGERGFTHDLRSRRGRKTSVSAGRREGDPQVESGGYRGVSA